MRGYIVEYKDNGDRKWRRLGSLGRHFPCILFVFKTHKIASREMSFVRSLTGCDQTRVVPITARRGRR
jgi:hypothetical protein